MADTTLACLHEDTASLGTDGTLVCTDPTGSVTTAAIVSLDTVNGTTYDPAENTAELMSYWGAGWLIVVGCFVIAWPIRQLIQLFRRM